MVVGIGVRGLETLNSCIDLLDKSKYVIIVSHRLTGLVFGLDCKEDFVIKKALWLESTIKTS